jgi:hypothetical protein
LANQTECPSVSVHVYGGDVIDVGGNCLGREQCVGHLESLRD